MQNNHSCSYDQFHGKRRCERRGGVGFAIFLIGTGILFLLSHFNMLGGYRVVQFWPLLLVWPAISCLIRARSWYGRSAALLLFLFSDLALAHSLKLMAIPWGVVWPFAVVVIGAVLMARIILSPSRTSTFKIPADIDSNTDMLQTRIVCGGNKEDFGTGIFHGGLIEVFMGGYELDLRAAEMAGESAELYVKLKLAGVKLRVPQEWKVTIEGETFMGEIEDTTTTSTMGDVVAKELKIHALVRQGALEIEN
jgi:predicted membrane protein